MAKIGTGLGIGAVVLGGIALLVPTLFAGATGFSRTGGYGGCGGTMGGYGGMMGGYGGMMGGYGGLGGGWGLVGLVSQLGFFLLLVGGAYLLFRFVTDGGGVGGSRDEALEELRKAYARGDVSDEEFETRRETLSRTENDR